MQVLHEATPYVEIKYARYLFEEKSLKEKWKWARGGVQLADLDVGLILVRQWGEVGGLDEQVSDCSIVLRRFWPSQWDLELKLSPEEACTSHGPALVALLCSVFTEEHPMESVALAPKHRSWGPWSISLLCRRAEWHLVMAATHSSVAPPPPWSWHYLSPRESRCWGVKMMHLAKPHCGAPQLTSYVIRPGLFTNLTFNFSTTCSNNTPSLWVAKRTISSALMEEN